MPEHSEVLTVLFYAASMALLSLVQGGTALGIIHTCQQQASQATLAVSECQSKVCSPGSPAGPFGRLWLHRHCHDVDQRPWDNSVVGIDAGSVATWCRPAVLLAVLSVWLVDVVCCCCCQHTVSTLQKEAAWSVGGQLHDGDVKTCIMLSRQPSSA